MNNQLKAMNPVFPIVSTMLIGFGFTMLLLSGAYIQDINLLRRVPEAVWQFVCGIPPENEMVLPMLLAVSALTMCIGIGLLVFGWIKAKGQLLQQQA
ncbi:MAG: hypothetical protein GFH27_549283n114 [Chloroflexi bacterium AL-W]|nr:hypothetical protein [Chloroflexi bacterium AL-N1]NOK64765.1 hypothetical protein [Chloroflexi bacterium AL-N10]NOK76006.1 hypothetical protein [Chloroflexi bacterium AL-N5]NOK80235.1 hypothetical protein [Chloroflexi bacterium AL-W]NOK86748.1 hypothetical protein [Chloroflexi bacterium AL-N15]